MAVLLARLGTRQGFQTLRRCTPITQHKCSLKTTNKKGETVFPGLHPELKREEDRSEKDEVRRVVFFIMIIFFFQGQVEMI